MGNFLIFKKKESSMEWAVTNKKNALLGDIAFEPKLNKFVFYPDQMCFDKEIWFAEDCLRQMADKLKEINAHKY